MFPIPRSPNVQSVGLTPPSTNATFSPSTTASTGKSAAPYSAGKSCIPPSWVSGVISATEEYWRP